jgi:hypothetical protein
MNTKEKGDLAVAKATVYFIERGNEVLLPFGDKQPYDMVIERKNKLLKVQCKYTNHKSEYGVYIVPVRVMGGNRSRNTAKTYEKGDFDILFVYTESGDIYEIPSKIWTKYRNAISLGKYFDGYKSVRI